MKRIIPSVEGLNRWLLSWVAGELLYGLAVLIASAEYK